MLSKSKLKMIASLSQKKFRDETGLFIAEGTKTITDLSASFQCSILVATREWLLTNSSISATEIIEVEENELKKISNQKSPQGALGVFIKPKYSWDAAQLSTVLTLALDDVQDPGNLGTIIRIADWFGIKNIFCSVHSADAFSPKTVQATMGALARVRVHYVLLSDFLTQMATSLPIYGTHMDGKNIYYETLNDNGIVVMGNEGNGISAQIEELITQRLLIPNYPKGEATSESLNVGVATALVCAEFRRRKQ